ncbi:MAG: tetratricopeptide repeat protein [Bdellovibrionales bacterium]|nr:tetratricopeptide repeat protein [Bdellovibrionales bacterium]
MISLKTNLLFSILLVVCGCAAQKSNSITADPISGVSVDSKENNYAHVIREQGYKRYLAGEFTRAINHFEAYLVLDPKGEDQWIKYLLYYCYMAVGEYERALTLAKDLVHEKPYDFLSYQQIGLAQLWLGKLGDAIKNFQRSLEFESHLPQALFYQGLAYGQARQFDKQEAVFKDAENEYAQVLKSNPADFKSNYEMANLYLYWNKEVEKVPALISAAKGSLTSRLADEDVLREESVYLNFHIPLLEGIYLYRTEKYQKSLHLLLAALVNAPTGTVADLSELYYYMGANYLALEDPVRARSFLEKANRLDPRGMYAEVTRKMLRGISPKKSE